MVLRSLNFSSIKTTRFYLSQNQSSAAGSQAAAAIWCSRIARTAKIPAVFALFRTIVKFKIDFPGTRTQIFPCGNLVIKQK
jgi:hypothetical protein